MELQFVLSEQTKAIIPMFDENGYPYTEIIHGTERIKMPSSALSIIDFNLKRRGSSLRGMKDSVKELLNNADFYPIIIPAAEPLLFVVTDSFRSGRFIFLALHQIHAVQPFDETHTTVHFYGGQSVTVPVPIKKLQKRIARAHESYSRYFHSYIMKVENKMVRLHIKITFDGGRMKLEE